MFVIDVGGSTFVRNDYSTPISKNGIPNWERIPHKGMLRPTDAEFNTIIEGLSKEYTEAKKNNDADQCKVIGDKMETALGQYVSIVSPDRKALVKEAEQLMQGLSSGGRIKSKEPLTLIDFLNMKGGVEVSKTNGEINAKLSFGTEITFSNPNASNFYFKIKSGGTEVMSNFNGEWLVSLTPQERAKQSSFLSLFNSAVNRHSMQGLKAEIQPEGKLDIKA